MKIRHYLMPVAALVGLTACDDSTGPADGTSLSLSVGVPAASQFGAPLARIDGLASAQTYDDGTNVLVIERVALVLAEIELEGVDDDDCEDGDVIDDCDEFEAGPYLLELPLDGSIDQVVSIQVPAGVYEELEFEIEVPDDDTGPEADFVAANPDFEGVSIRVEGTFNGEPFVYLSDLDEEQELELDPPLEITEGADATNLTLSLDISGWFVDGNGDLIDPASANDDGPNEGLVEDNIERSLEAYEDDDRDGDDDSDDD